MEPPQIANPGVVKTISVDGRPVTLDWLQEGHTLDDPRTLTVTPFLNRPLPSSLLTAGSSVQVELNGEQTPFRVTGVQEATSANESIVYVVTLTEIMPRLASNGPSDEIEVLYRTAISAIIARTQIRALGQLLEAKGVISADEYQAQMENAIDTSFLHFAREIVAQEEAEQMREAVLFDLPDHVDSMTGHEFPFVGVDVADDLDSASEESS